MITFPRPSPAQFGYASVRWGTNNNTARAKSPFTFQDVVQVFDGAMWRGTLSILPQTAAEGRALAAWLVSLKGTRGTFLLGDPAAAAPLGSAAMTPGAPVVDGAGQTGDELAVRGLPASAAGYLKAGDYLQLGSGAGARLYMALENVDSDGAGLATISIWPRLRASPADGAPIAVDNPQGVFAQTQPGLDWTERLALIYDGVQLNVEEVVT